MGAEGDRSANFPLLLPNLPAFQYSTIPAVSPHHSNIPLFHFPAVSRRCQNPHDLLGMIDSGDTLGLSVDAIDEMVDLDFQRLFEIDFRQQYITGPIVEGWKMLVVIIHVFSQNRFAFDAFVVNRDLVFRRIVVHHHFLGTHDGDRAHPGRIQPAHMNIGHHLVGIKDVQKNDIFDIFLDVRHASAHDRCGLGITEPILDDADIVGGKVP